jgi:pimeloyl-ACP methyl ester carboxylesterase
VKPPFNGFDYYLNNRRTNQAEGFMTRVALDTSMRKLINRIRVPTLLVYGRNDLIAPVEVGEGIYRDIGTASCATDASRRPNSRPLTGRRAPAAKPS